MNDVVDYLISKGKLNHFSERSIVDEDIIEKYGKEVLAYCNIYYLSLNFLEKYIDIVDINDLSKHPEISISFVLKHNKKDWNWFYLTRNGGITMKDIESKSLYWDELSISGNPNQV